MKKHIYADNAASSKLSEVAFEKMKQYMIEDYGNPSQPYSFSRSSKKALKEARLTIASALGAKLNEIFFTSGGTESDNWVIKCFSNAQHRVIITSSVEHHAILNACKSAKENGTKIYYLRVNSKGLIDICELENALQKYKEYDVLVSIMTANNEIGTIEPIREISALCHKYGAIFHTDAVQAIGHIKINVNDLGIDMLSASAHKFNGPKGIGFLYVKDNIKIASFIDGGSQESQKRAGTENVPAIVGMAYALKESLDLIDETQSKLKNMENLFIKILDNNRIDYIINGDRENHLPGLLNISIKNANGEMLLHRLDLLGFYISTGSACDGKNNQVSHVIKEINVDKEYAEGTIRVSFGRMNELSDSTKLACALVTMLKEKI